MKGHFMSICSCKASASFSKNIIYDKASGSALSLTCFYTSTKFQACSYKIVLIKERVYYCCRAEADDIISLYDMISKLQKYTNCLSLLFNIFANYTNCSLTALCGLRTDQDGCPGNERLPSLANWQTSSCKLY